MSKNHSHTEVSAAARNEIEDQRDKFYSENRKKTVECGYCGKPIGPRAKVEVDHIKFFDELIIDFVKLNKLKDEEIGLKKFTHPIDETTRYRFSNSSLSKKWKAYHLEHATLRCIHKTCNKKHIK